MNSQNESIPFNGLYWIVEDALYLEGYKVKVWFRDGSVKIVDLEETLSGGLLEPLKDQALFAKLRFDEEASTIVWPNGADLAPEFLYQKGQDVTWFENQVVIQDGNLTITSGIG